MNGIECVERFHLGLFSQLEDSHLSFPKVQDSKTQPLRRPICVNHISSSLLKYSTRFEMKIIHLRLNYTISLQNII